MSTHPPTIDRPTRHDPALVIGGTGTTGRRVAKRLAARGVPHRVGSRRASPAFDWQRPEGWPAVLAGMPQAYVAYHPDLAFPGATDHIARLTRAAAEAGLTRLVLLSGRGEPAAEECERIVQGSGLAWTVLRCSWFAQNFSESFFLPPVLDGALRIPAADAVEPFVDADDIADVAVAALTEPGHGGEVYELSGPRALGFAEVAAILSEATGRSIAYQPVSHAAYAEELAAQGLPADFADLFALVLDGRNATPTDGVRRALGRPPRDFADYARATAATGVWQPAAVAR